MKCDKCGYEIKVDPYRTVDVNPKFKMVRRSYKAIISLFTKQNLIKVGIFAGVIVAILFVLSIVRSIYLASDNPTYCYTDTEGGFLWLKGNVEWAKDPYIANNEPEQYNQYCNQGEKVYDCYSRICLELTGTKLYKKR